MKTYVGSRGIFSAFLVAMLVTVQSEALASVLDDWQKLIQDGSSKKFDGQYKEAIQIFSQAVNLSQNQKLPAKCLPIALCRLTDAEVSANQVNKADSNFKQIVDLIEEQKESGVLDPKVKFWAAALSDSYISNTKPETREVCLKRACYLKALIYGDKHSECIECLNKLVTHYIENSEVAKALRILNTIQTMTDKKSVKNPDTLSKMLDQLAIKYRREHKYEQAKQLELAAINAINKDSSLYLRLSKPDFYCFIGMSAFAQEKDVEGCKYFHQAIEECSRISTKKERDMVCQSLGREHQCIVQDMFEDKRFSVAEKEIRQLLAVYKSLHREPKHSNGTDGLLSNVLELQHKNSELIKLLENRLKDPDLTPNEQAGMRTVIAKAQASRSMRQMEMANKNFALAFKLEENKQGRDATAILLWWGTALVEYRHVPAGLAMLNRAYKQSCALSNAQRGTLLSDVLQVVANIKSSSGRTQEAQVLLQESAKEFEAQKKAKVELWPNLYNRK